MPDDEREMDGVWEECPRCLIAFELDVLSDHSYFLVCPCCGMTRLAV